MNFYHLIGVITAFALMGLITISAGAMAVRFNSLLIAVLGILGGYGTPVMLATGATNFPGLFSYTLLLGCGILGISIKKNWHLLNYIGFVCTYGLFLGAMPPYRPQDFWSVMPFLVGFFVLYSTSLFLFNVVNRVKSTLLEVIGLLLNAAIFFAAGYYLVEHSYGYRAVASISLGLSAFYAAHVYYFLYRKVTDRELMLSFLGLAALFLGITVPLVLSREWITVSWAIQALVMLWLADKMKSEFLRQLAFLLYGIMLFRFGFLDLPSQYLTIQAGGTSLSLGDYAAHLVERLVVFGVPVASMAGAHYLLRTPATAASLVVDDANDVDQWIRTGSAVRATLAVAIGMLFLFLHLELNRSAGYLFPPCRMPVLSLLWLAICWILLSEYRAHPRKPVLMLLGLFVAAVLIKLLHYDLDSWSLGETMLYGGGYSFLDASMRLLDFGAIIAFLVLAYSRLAGADSKAWVPRWRVRSPCSGVPLPDPGAQHVPLPFRARPAGRRNLDPLVGIRPGADPGGHPPAARSTPLRRTRALHRGRRQGVLRRPGQPGSVLPHHRLHPPGRPRALRRIPLPQVPANLREPAPPGL